MKRMSFSMRHMPDSDIQTSHHPILFFIYFLFTCSCHWSLYTHVQSYMSVRSVLISTMISMTARLGVLYEKPCGSNSRISGPFWAPNQYALNNISNENIDFKIPGTCMPLPNSPLSSSSTKKRQRSCMISIVVYSQHSGMPRRQSLKFKNIWSCTVRNTKRGTGGIAWQLEIFTTLAEDPSLVVRAHMMAHSYL